MFHLGKFTAFVFALSMYFAGNGLNMFAIYYIRYSVNFIVLLYAHKMLSLTVRTVIDGRGVLYRNYSLLGLFRCPSRTPFDICLYVLLLHVGFFCAEFYYSVIFLCFAVVDTLMKAM